jgi:hypothetical protein
VGGVMILQRTSQHSKYFILTMINPVDSASGASCE